MHQGLGVWEPLGLDVATQIFERLRFDGGWLAAMLLSFIWAAPGERTLMWTSASLEQIPLPSGPTRDLGIELHP